MKKRVLPIFLSVLVMMSCAHTDIDMPENAARRPRLGNGTVLTSRGTRLRGAYWSLDFRGELPDREAVREIRDFGMNTLHVYAERHDAGVPAGSYVKQMDTLVQWCGEEGLYCVIVIGGGGHNGMFDIDFARKFWNAYAPRYRNMPWVIYEIYNEPFTNYIPPYDEATLAMEQEMYDLIRKLAPETMILLFSYGGLFTTASVVRDVARLKVDWSNAAAAFHGYGPMKDENMRTLKAAGINSICTELSISSPFSDDQVNPGEIDKCERNEISWLVFMEIKAGYLASWRFKQEIDKRKLGWQPDFGTWPTGPSAYVPPHDLALGKKTDVSSVENFQGTALSGKYATDGDDLTRWGSAFADDQYIIVDLEKPAAFDTIMIRWDGQYAVAYDVLVSNDMTNWKRIYETTNGTGGDLWVYWKERIHVTATARYLKLFLKKRRMEYGFSICSLEVYDTKKEE